MSTKLITDNLWPTLTKAVRKNSAQCHVAVAYFGQGASKLLPLAAGSRLVVNASERVVKAGATCPAELIELQERHVKIFSRTNLHAKVYVVGKSAFVGSANVSSNSAGTLVEALLLTTDASAVRDARQFVADASLHELGPEALAALAKIYRPPRIPGGNGSKNPAQQKPSKSAIPPLKLAQLKIIEWPDRDQKMYETGLSEAKKYREHPRKYEVDTFRQTGDCNYKRGDVVVRVTKAPSGKALVSPPGNVLYVKRRKNGNKRVSFVYVEYPAKRRRTVETVARQLQMDSPALLLRGGLVRNEPFARDLLRLWAG